MRTHRRFLHLSLLALTTGCAEGISPAPPAEAPAPGPVGTAGPPSIDGQYVMGADIQPAICTDQTGDAYHDVMLADVTEEDDPAVFSVSYYAAPFGADATAYGLHRGDDGAFLTDDMTVFNIGTGDITLKRHIDGAVSSDMLSYDLTTLVGWPNQDGSFHLYCTMPSKGSGWRRHHPWSGAPRTGVDGEWRTRLTTLEDSKLGPSGPKSTTLDTLVEDDGTVLLKGLMFQFLFPLAQDGAVSLEASSSDNHVALTGNIAPDALSLDFTWDWTDASTGALIWHRKEHYDGRPRYEPHVLGTGGPAAGTYTAFFAETSTTCGDTPTGDRYLIDVIPLADGSLWIWFAGERPAPVVPAADGSFHLAGSDDLGFRYDYAADGWIDGDAISFKLDVRVVNPYDNDREVCRWTDQVDGEKRYESFALPSK